ncbi:hypothetical protein CES85_4844 [Ochrobactrum quorumnocens]|uniref:Uncharacterized protein n=1 Tax=Ochrobactrum quorumnocens TaxID=271865 RepID=A0A248UB85_9HYPH|nr:hypothetical protein CES85_4844 [[Ochrobactrum] quorumnocens]
MIVLNPPRQIYALVHLEHFQQKCEAVLRLKMREEKSRAVRLIHF